VRAQRTANRSAVSPFSQACRFHCRLSLRVCKKACGEATLNRIVLCPREMKQLRRVLILAAVIICAVGMICGCELLKHVERNTNAIDKNRTVIETTTDSIQRNAVAVNESTRQIGINTATVETASEAVVANAEKSTSSLKAVQTAAMESTEAILDNERAIKTNTQAILENEHVVKNSTDTILKNGRALQQIDAVISRLGLHKEFIVIVSALLIILIVVPYVALWITLFRLHQLTKLLAATRPSEPAI
jgi:hypothetical protein